MADMYTMRDFINNSTLMQKALDTVTAILFKETALGNNSATLQTVYSKPNRFETNIISQNYEQKGPIFITRPKLNLSQMTLQQDRMLSCINTYDINSVGFMLRCLLDSNFSVFSDASPGRIYADQCKLFNNRSAFILPLSNAITSISGWPDYVLETETTEGGFKSEDLTFGKGWDRLNKTYNLTLTIRDFPGGTIMALFLIWFVYMGLLPTGEALMYGEDADRLRLCYTVSIYIFTLDRSKRFIQKWAKATGCFPIGVPIGRCFDFNEGESFISSSSKFSITFIANKIEYMDPAVFADFNAISQKFYAKTNDPNIIFDNSNSSVLGSLPSLPAEPKYNFMGIPFIDTHTNNIPELTYKWDTNIDQDPDKDNTITEESLNSIINDSGYLFDASLDERYQNIVNADTETLTNIYNTQIS